MADFSGWIVTVEVSYDSLFHKGETQADIEASARRYCELYAEAIRREYPNAEVAVTYTGDVRVDTKVEVNEPDRLDTAAEEKVCFELMDIGFNVFIGMEWLVMKDGPTTAEDKMRLLDQGIAEVLESDEELDFDDDGLPF